MERPERTGEGPGDDSCAYQSVVSTSGGGRAEFVEMVRERHGDEVADQWEHSLALGDQPRPLTADERLVVQETAAPVLRDLAATRVIVLDVQEEAHSDQGPGVVCAWVRGTDGKTGTGISILLAIPAAQRVAELAEQLQELELEELSAAGRPATWPECPEHPDSHPLEPSVQNDAAVWLCPRSRNVICAIGGIGAFG